MSEELEPELEHVADALALLPEQFKRKPNFEAFVTAFINVVQDAEDALQALWQGRFLDNAAGTQLDGLGSIVGEDREGREDDEYRIFIRIRIRANLSSGLADDIIDVFALLFETTTPAISVDEYFPAGLVLTLTEYSTISPDVMLELLDDVRAAAVNAQLVYLSAPAANSFCFASADSSETSSTQGFNGALGGIPTWTSANAAVDAAWASLEWSPALSLFVALATASGSNQVMTSPTGATWTARSASSSRTWNDLAWGSAISPTPLFVAVASDGVVAGRAMSSTNGTSWTARTTPDGEWHSVAYSPTLNRFVAVGLSGGPNYAMTSTNGTSWTVSGVTQIAGYWHSVVWCSGISKFVAVGRFDTGNGQVMYSSDGLTWSVAGVSVPEANQWCDVAYSSTLGIIVAVSVDGTNQVMTSPDGITWTARAEAAAQQWASVCWSPSFLRFIATNVDVSTALMYSADGITWTAGTAPASKQWGGIVDAPALGIVVATALADTTNAVMVSAEAEDTDTGGMFADVLEA